MRPSVRRHLIALLICLVLPSLASAQDLATGPDIPLLAQQSQRVVLFPNEVGAVPFALVVPAGSDWRLSGIERSCGCIETAPLPEILPGGSTIPFIVKVKADPGPVDKAVRVRVLVHRERDSAPATFTFEVETQVRDTLARSDGTWQSLDLGTLKTGTASGTATLAFTRGQHPTPWATMQVEAQGAGGTWTASVRPDGTGFQIPIAFRPAGKIGELSAVLGFRFLTEAGEALDYHPLLTVRARVPGPVQAIPVSAFLGVVELGSRRSARVNLEGVGTSMPPITGLASSDGGRLSATIGQADGKTWIDLSILGREPVGPASGWVEVTFGDACATVLRVPYVAAVAKPRSASP